MKDVAANFVAGLVIAILAAAFFFGIVKGTLYIEQRKCAARASAMQRDYRFGFWTHCMVSDGRGAFVPIDNYRDVRQEP